MNPKGSERLVIRLDPGAVDAIPLGIMRGDLEGRITYANSVVQRLMGPDIGLGARLQDFELAPGSRGVVEANLKQRFEAQQGSGYTVSIVHPDRTRVHAEISGVPEYSAEGGLVGSIGFVTDKTIDQANLAVHSAIGSASNWRDLLRALDDAVRDVLAFDAIVVNLISADRNALRISYERPERSSTVVPAWRWWPMPAFVRADLDAILTTRPDDIVVMFSAPPYLDLARNNPETQESVSTTTTRQSRWSTSPPSQTRVCETATRSPATRGFSGQWCRRASPCAPEMHGTRLATCKAFRARTPKCACRYRETACGGSSTSNRRSVVPSLQRSRRWWSGCWRSPD